MKTERTTCNSTLWKPFMVLGMAAFLTAGAPGNAGAQGLENLERLGFFDANFTRNDGFQSSTLNGMNEAGQAFGFSDRFQGGDFLGHIPWVFEAVAGSRQIGLAGSEFTRADGFQANAASELTAGGWLRGSAQRFAGGMASHGVAAWLADAASATTMRVGLTDAEHTGGLHQFSEATFITSDGLVGGYSNRYGDSSGEALGQSAWMARAVLGVAVTHRVGFTGGEYTRNDGYEFSVINRAVESGIAGGFSWRYEAATGNFLGEHAWVAHWAAGGGVTDLVGFYDAEHTDTDGYQFSRLQWLNDAGEGAGYSARFDAGADAGLTAWVSSPEGAETRRVGLVDANHTRTDGYRWSDVTDITDSGLVGGYSASFIAPAAGQSAWVAVISNAETMRVGLTGGEFQSASGREVSYLRGLAESGFAIGGSQRFLGESANGEAAWLAAPAGGSYDTMRIGLVDAEHTSSSGAQESVAELLGESGRVTGYSLRYVGSSYAGQSAWVASADGVTTRVGLTGAEFTSADGFQYNSAEYLTAGGRILGYAERYNGGDTWLGEASWVASTNGETTKIGLYDGTHTKDDGYQMSVISLVTESGYVAGSSERFDGGAIQLGASAWVYLPHLDLTEEIVFSTALSGEAYTQIEVLTESGLAAGYYTLFDGDTAVGSRAFAWLPEIGGFDLGDYIGGAQFSSLTDVTAANLANYIAGIGEPLDNQGQAVFAATVVPEPGTLPLVLLGIGIAALAVRKFRRAGSAVLLAAAIQAAPGTAQAQAPVSYSAWASETLPGEEAGATVDPDGDGFMNAVEFVFGSDPSTPDAPADIAPVLDTADPEQAYFIYRRSDQSMESAVVRVMTSDALGNWEPAEGEPVILEEHEGFKVFGHPVQAGGTRFYTLEVRIPGGLSNTPQTLGEPLDLVIHIGANAGSAWEGLPPLPNVSILTQAAPVSATDPTPDTSKYPSAAGAGRGNFTANLLHDYQARGVRPPLRSWMGWFLWGDGAPPPGIKAGIHAPGDYGTYTGAGWDYFNYQWPKNDSAPDGGRSNGTWNPVRVDQQPLFLNPFVVNYNWAPGPFGYESKPMKNFPNNAHYWQDKTIVRGVNLSTVNPFFYQYGNKLTASSVPVQWHQAWLYLAMRPLETTVVVPGNLRPEEVLQPGVWNSRPGGTNDPFPYPVWDKNKPAEEQTPFALKVDRVGDFDADIIYEAANPIFPAYYEANRYQRTGFAEPGKGNYLKMTVGQGMPFAWCETHNNRYVTFYNLIRENTGGRINNNAGTGAGVVQGGPWDVPGVSGVKFVLLYGDHVNPNQWYQEVPPWYFDAPSKQPGGFNPPPGDYKTKGGGTTNAPGQHNHTYTAVFYRTDSARPVTLTPQPGAPGYNNGLDAQGNPFFYLEFVKPDKNWFVVANVPSMRYYHTGITPDRRSVLDQAARDWASTLGQYAFNFPTSTKVAYTVENMSESRSTFSVELKNPYVAAGASGAGSMTLNPKDTVIALNPHQYQPIKLGPDLTKAAQPEVTWQPLRSHGKDFPVPTSAPPNANRTTPTSPSRWGYWSLRGNLKPVITGSFTVAYPFQNFLPALPAPDYTRQIQQTGIPGIIITDVGTGYHKITDAPTVTISNSSNSGSGAAAKALVDAYRGEIQQIDVVSGGQGYPDGMPPETVTVTISPPSSPNGRQATAYAQVGGGKVLAIFMLDKGSGYSSVITVRQDGQLTDPPIIVPRFDPVTGALLPGLVNVVEEGAGFDFTKPLDTIHVDLFGTGTGAQFQIIRPGNLIQIDPPLGGTGSAGSYPSIDNNPPNVTVAIEPATPGGTAQTASARMAKIPGGWQPAIIAQGDYADAEAVTASFSDDSVPAKTVPLHPIMGGGKLLGLGLGPNPPEGWVLNSPKNVDFAGGNPTTPAAARVYPTYSVDSATITGSLVDGYTSDVQVSFLAADLNDPAVPSVKAPEINFTIPEDGEIKAANLTIVDGGAGLTYDPVNYQVFGGLGFDAAFQAVLNESGGVKTVRILHPGSNYLPNLKVWFNQGGHTGTPAQADVVVQDGKITAVNVTNPGTGYNGSLSILPVAGTWNGSGNPDPTVMDNPKGYPALFTAVLTGGAVTGFNQSLPPPGTAMAKYIPGSEGAATKSSPPALLWCSSGVPFARVTSPAFFFRGRVAPPATRVDEVIYNSIIDQYTKLTGNGLAPFNGTFLGSSAPDGYGLGNQLGSAANFLGDVFNLQQSLAANGADYPDVSIAPYALDSAKSPTASYEFPVFAQNNPFGSMTDSLRSSVQGMQRALTLLFQSPPSQNSPAPESLANLWNESYYAQYDDGVGRIVINPTATQPAWGVVSSVQNPAEVSAAENATKTGLSKWERGMLWSGFGVSDQWNDQHYFYGYYISSAALAGIFDRAWSGTITGKPTDLWASPGQMGTAIDQLVMTLAYDPDNAALVSSLYSHPPLGYQKLAFFDQFNGHPWASGASPGSTTAVLDTSNPLGFWGAYGTLSDKYNGENENSVFEGIQAWSATILWGAATDRKAVLDLGIYLYSANLAAGEAYFLDKNYNMANSALNQFSWVPVTTIDSADVINNGNNTGWPANTSYVDSNPDAFYEAPEAFGGKASAGQSLTKKAESTLNNFFYAYPTGSRFIQAYPPTAWTLGMARNSTYMRTWAGTMMRGEWKLARESALYQPAEWLSMSMTAALAGVPYQPGDQPYPMTGTTPNSPAVGPYIDRIWSSWVTTSTAPGANAARNPSVLATSVLTYLSSLRDHGTPDWTYVARATDSSGADDNSSIVLTAAFTKRLGPTSIETTFVAFNPGWETRHAAFYRLNPDGTRGTQPASGSGPLTVPPKRMVTHKVVFNVE